MRSVPSSTKFKKRFLRWFIVHYLNEDDDAHWLLEDIMTDEPALMRLQFVNNIEEYPKGMIISTFEDEKPFLFFKGSVHSENVYTAYHELQLYDHEQFFIQIKFPSADSHRLYQVLLREEKTYKKRDQAVTTHLLNHLLEKGRKEHILEEIDKSLDEQNYERFIHYSTLLKKDLKNNESL